MRIQHFLLAAATIVATAGVSADAASGGCRAKTAAPTASSSTGGSSTTVTDAPSTTDASTGADASTGNEAADNYSVDQSSDWAWDDESTTSDAVDSSSSAVDADADSKSGVTTTAPTATTSAPSSTTAAPSATSAASTSGSSASTSTSSNSTSTATSTGSSSGSGLCSTPRVVITEIDVGVEYEASEDEATLEVLAIAAKPSGGSRVAFQSGDYVYVYELDSDDAITSTSAVKVPAIDFADIYADDDGFVIMGTRDAEGGGTLNCGSPSNLCSAPDTAVPCYDMYLMRYDGSTETWATKLTSSSASLPPYSTSATGPDVYMIWWYAHHGRIAFDGTNWASYFGCALSVSESSCINIHQGDRMKVVSPDGDVLSDHNSFDWGCSHSGYERITYDNRSSEFAMICKTDNNDRIMPPDNYDVTIYSVDLDAANLGDIVNDGSSSGGGYWATVSNGDGDDAAVHLIHFTLDATADQDITLTGGKTNERAPHLATIGSGGLLAMWEGSSTGGDLVEGSSDRTIFIQTLDATSGDAISDVVTVDSSVVGNRYQALKSYPDGTVAYLSKGTTSTSLQVVRFHGC